jgi:putative oxidoreductase
MTTTASPIAGPSKVLHVALWVAQAALGALFGIAGLLKLTQSIAQLSATLGWPASVAPWLVRGIGLCEVAGAVGVILPATTRYKTWLTPLAAGGLAVLMGLALGFHARRGEWLAVLLNVAIGVIAVFVAWGRTRAVPLAEA